MSVPLIMDHPELLAKGEHWRRTCPHCGLTTQGGRAGLNAHLTVVHPGQRKPA